MNGVPLILKKWDTKFDFQQEFPTTIPLWVRFPNLPLNCWGPVTLSKIASSLGEPVYADECTKNQTRISYARVLVDMDTTQELPTVVEIIEPSGRVFTQKVEYDWKPAYCKKCVEYGHVCKEDTRKGIVQPLRHEEMQNHMRTKIEEETRAKKLFKNGTQLDNDL